MGEIKIKLSELEILQRAGMILSVYGNWYFKRGIRKNLEMVSGEVDPAIKEIDSLPEIVAFRDEMKKANGDISKVSDEIKKAANEAKAKIMSEEIEFMPYRFLSHRIPDTLSSDLVKNICKDKETCRILGNLSIDGLFGYFDSMLDCVDDSEA